MAQHGSADDHEAVTSPVAGNSLATEDELTVVFDCVWCGKRVEIKRSDKADELADATAFAAEHADCLRRITQPGGDRDT